MPYTEDIVLFKAIFTPDFTQQASASRLHQAQRFLCSSAFTDMSTHIPFHNVYARVTSDRAERQ